MKSIKRGKENSSLNNNDDLRKSLSEIGGEIRNSSFRQQGDEHITPTKKVDERTTIARGTCEDRIPPQYSTGEDGTSPEAMDDDRIPLSEEERRRPNLPKEQ